MSDDRIREALATLPRQADLGAPNGYVRIGTESLHALDFDIQTVDAWILEHGGYPDDRRHSRNQLGSGVSTRRAPKVDRSWLIPVDALDST